MSDSVSISFVREPRKGIMGAIEREESVTIYTTSGGMSIVKLASGFIDALNGIFKGFSGSPISRREPDALIAPFISAMSEDIIATMRVLPTESRIKNTVNGHWQIDVYTGKAKKIMEAEKHE